MAQKSEIRRNRTDHVVSPSGDTSRRNLFVSPTGDIIIYLRVPRTFTMSFRGSMPSYKHRIGEWSGEVEHNGQKAFIKAVLWGADQSFGYQTDFTQVPVWYAEINNLTDNTKKTLKTRDEKKKDRWLADFQKLLKQS